MIEVLKHGEKPKSTFVTTKCPECGCIFRFNVDEDTYHTRIFCEDRVDCPDCGQYITVHDTSCWNKDIERIICPNIDYDV
jgi:ribosomal protein S27E